MKKRNLIVLLAMVWSLSSNLFAQDTTKVENPISVSCDIVSRYVWRGISLDAGPNIQPGIEYAKSGFTLGAWGAYGVNNQGYQESDFYIGYTFYKEMFGITLSDYYFQSDFVDQNYFDYNSESTGHIFELALSYNGTEDLPLSFLVAANIYGADSKKINDNGTIGDNQFSTYAELAYTFKHFDAFMGANLTQVDTDKGEAGFYGDSVGIVNLGIKATKDIKITKDFSLPLNVSIITNPQAEKIYFVAGFSF